MISIAGRPRRNWDGSIRVLGEGAVLRLDDRDDPEFWLEVAIDAEEIERIASELVVEALERGKRPPFIVI